LSDEEGEEDEETDTSNPKKHKHADSDNTDSDDDSDHHHDPQTSDDNASDVDSEAGHSPQVQDDDSVMGDATDDEILNDDGNNANIFNMVMSNTSDNNDAVDEPDEVVIPNLILQIVADESNVMPFETQHYNNCGVPEDLSHNFTTYVKNHAWLMQKNKSMHVVYSNTSSNGMNVLIPPTKAKTVFGNLDKTLQNILLPGGVRLNVAWPLLSALATTAKIHMPTSSLTVLLHEYVTNQTDVAIAISNDLVPGTQPDAYRVKHGMKICNRMLETFSPYSKSTIHSVTSITCKVLQRVVYNTIVRLLIIDVYGVDPTSEPPMHALLLFYERESTKNPLCVNETLYTDLKTMLLSTEYIDIMNNTPFEHDGFAPMELMFPKMITGVLSKYYLASIKRMGNRPNALKQTTIINVTSAFLKWHYNHFEHNIHGSSDNIYNQLCNSSGAIGLSKHMHVANTNVGTLSNAQHPRDCITMGMSLFTGVWVNRFIHILHECVLVNEWTVVSCASDNIIIYIESSDNIHANRITSHLNNCYKSKGLWCIIISSLLGVPNAPTVQPNNYINPTVPTTMQYTLTDLLPTAPTDDNKSMKMNIIALISTWALKHKAVREIDRNDNMTIYVPVGDTMIYKPKIKEKSIVVEKKSSNRWLCSIIEEESAMLFGLFSTGSLMNKATQNEIIAHMERNPIVDFPIYSPGTRNRRTLLATKKGWVDLHKFLILGMGTNRSMANLVFEDIFHPYTDDTFIDPETGEKPFCTDSTFIDLDFEKDVFPKLKMNDLNQCTTMLMVLATQIAMKNIKDVSQLTDDQLEYFKLQMSVFGHGASPGEPSLKIMTIINGLPGVGKSTILKQLQKYVGSTECKSVNETKNATSKFATGLLVNYDVGRMPHVCTAPDLEKLDVLEAFPNVKIWLGIDMAAVEGKHEKEMLYFNTNDADMISNLQKIHDAAPASIFIATNLKTALGLEELGWTRRVNAISMRFGGVKQDTRIDKIWEDNCCVEMMYCTWQYARIKHMMSIPQPDGSLLSIESLYPNNAFFPINGRGLIYRSAELFFANTAASGKWENLHEFLNEHLCDDDTNPIRYVSLNDIYDEFCKKHPRTISRVQMDAYLEKSYNVHSIINRNPIKTCTRPRATYLIMHKRTTHGTGKCCANATCKGSFRAVIANKTLTSYDSGPVYIPATSVNNL
jgi:hypothetical protein